MNTMKEKKFVKVIYKECPMCRQETYLRLTKEQMEQCTKYTCCGGLIQDVLPSLDKFGREFVKMGYCPSCQEILYQSTLKDKSPYFSRSELDDDRIYEFSKATDKLSVPEKVIYLFEMDLEKEYYVDNDGKIKKLDETV